MNISLEGRDSIQWWIHKNSPYHMNQPIYYLNYSLLGVVFPVVWKQGLSTVGKVKVNINVLNLQAILFFRCALISSMSKKYIIVLEKITVARINNTNWLTTTYLPERESKGKISKTADLTYIFRHLLAATIWPGNWFVCIIHQHWIAKVCLIFQSLMSLISMLFI